MGIKKLIRHDIRLRSVIILMIVISSVISVLLLIAMHQTTVGYTDMLSATQDYVDSHTSADAIQDCIDDLSGKARRYVVRGDAEEAILYCNEVLMKQTRQKAVEEIRSKLSNERTLSHLSTAMELSDRLVEVETYAMRLAISGWGGTLERYPDMLRAVRLEEEDLKRSPEEQLERARELVFDDAYESLKGQVGIRITLCINDLVELMKENQQASAEELLRRLIRQRLLIYALMLTLLTVTVFIFAMVIRPLSRQVTHITRDEKLDVMGTSEVRFLARTYNRLYEETHRQYEKLNYEVMHDALTGAYNRNAYDEYRSASGDQGIALLIIDIDKFKEINDSFGHDIGDRLLVRVAKELQRAFRGNDLVCRIGGDEFSIIVVDADSSMEDQIMQRMETVMKTLRQREDETPGITLSVGIAFADQASEDENLFRNADRALYQIKASGRNGCAVYRKTG